MPTFSGMRVLLGVAAVIALLVSTLTYNGADAASSGSATFTSPYNSAFSVEVSLLTNDRTPAVSFSNQFAGFRQVDPLVAPGQGQSHHLHAWLGSRFSANANINALYDEPIDWESGSNADDRGRGFAGQTIYKGKLDGYTSGVWWPALWDAPPGKTPRRVTYLDGISAYYVATPQHGGQYLTAYPNGLSFLVDEFVMKERPDGRGFNVNFFGPNYWDGRSLTSSDHRSHVSDVQSASHPIAIPEFQTFVKARLAYPDDNTPLEDRIKFGSPGAFTPPHLDYVAGFRQPWFHQWLLDLGPNWGHPDNQLRDCGVSMPNSLQRRKLEGVRLPPNIGNGGTATCGSAPAPAPTPVATTRPTTTRPPTTRPPTTRPAVTSRPVTSADTTTTVRAATATRPTTSDRSTTTVRQTPSSIGARSATSTIRGRSTSTNLLPQTSGQGATDPVNQVPVKVESPGQDGQTVAPTQSAIPLLPSPANLPSSSEAQASDALVADDTNEPAGTVAPQIRDQDATSSLEAGSDPLHDHGDHDHSALPQSSNGLVAGTGSQIVALSADSSDEALQTPTLGAESGNSPSGSRLWIFLGTFLGILLAGAITFGVLWRRARAWS